jgi:hypothetical protein
VGLHWGFTGASTSRDDPGRRGTESCRGFRKNTSSKRLMPNFGGQRRTAVEGHVPISLLNGIQEVSGSIPLGSTSESNDLENIIQSVILSLSRYCLTGG